MSIKKYKYVSISNVIAEYNAMYKNHPVDKADAVNWIYDTIRHVGSVDNYSVNIVKLPSDNGLVEIPCDVYRIISVEHSSLLCKDPIAFEDNGDHIILYDKKLKSVVVKYNGLMTDKDGYPLITEETKDAAVQNIFLRNVANPDWYTGKISDQKYQMINQEYHRLCGNARGTMRYYNRNDMERGARISRKMLIKTIDLRNYKTKI